MILISCLLAFTSFSSLCLCFNPKNFTSLSTSPLHWGSAGATWYGSPDGAGSDGGACGYGGAVSQSPFASMITATGPSLYKSGQECGACYMVKCTKLNHMSCSGRPVRVVITDSCPGGPCLSEKVHFDLSGSAFGAMAKTGQEKKLRDTGILKIRYARVACDYKGQRMAFHVDQGSNSNYFAVAVEFEEGDGDLLLVELRQSSSHNEKWRSMQQSWGAVWKLDAGSELHAPFSIRLTSRFSRSVLVAKNVIPIGWQPGLTYRSIN
ncbi:expansin-B15-like [Impatiens glandulifera]|uniref:expansin-B15-like n=1 Tax=Impatiens glandulifera TaxID=253017 RepID=UPI001FB0BC27|nr:expansin-B15-like [Impatiens glandulifera]